MHAGAFCHLQHPRIASQVCDGHQQTLKLLLLYGAYIHLYIPLLFIHPTLLHNKWQLTVDYLDAFDLVIIDYNKWCSVAMQAQMQVAVAGLLRNKLRPQAASWTGLLLLLLFLPAFHSCEHLL